MTTEQITLELPGTESHGQITLNLTLALTGVLEQAKPRDVTTWQGMAEELGDRLGEEFAALTLMAQGLVIGHALGHTATSMSLDDYLAEMASHDGATAAGLAHHIAKDALGMTAAWGIDA